MPRETGRRRRNADDDESSSEDEQQTTTTTTTTVAQEPPAVAPPAAAAPAPPTRVRAKAPAAAVVKPPVLPSHADPTSAAPAAAAVTAPAPVAPKKPANSSDDDDDSSSEDDSKERTPVPSSTSGAHSALAQELEKLNYDTMTYAALLSLMKQASRPVIEELMAQREQQVESTNQQLQNYRVERFLDAGTSADAAGNTTAAANSASEEDSTEGYRYNAMLTRLFEALNRNNEGSAMTERNQLPVPILERMGKKKTVIVNFGRICEAFHRPMEDVKDFIEKELSIRGNVDSNDALILKYEIRKQTDFDRVLIKYLDEYVKCNSCHRIDTTLTKDGRRLELRCNVCTATRTVTAASTATFSAQIEKRSRQRAAMTL